MLSWTSSCGTAPICTPTATDNRGCALEGGLTLSLEHGDKDDALDIASANGRSDMVLQVLNSGASAGARNSSALRIAARGDPGPQQIVMMDILLQHGVDPHA